MKQDEVVKTSLIQVTANSLVNKDITVEDAVHIAKDAGADGFEVRRELLSPDMQPSKMQDMRLQLEQFSTPPAYSVPYPLFVEGCLNRDVILQALNEARADVAVVSPPVPCLKPQQRGSEFADASEVLRQMAPQYREALSVHKRVIVDAFVRLTGYHRTYAMWLLNHADEGQRSPVHPPSTGV